MKYMPMDSGFSETVAKCHLSSSSVSSLKVQSRTKKMANLPLKRMESTPPFMYSGMDCFRPFYVKEIRKGLKKYRFIFIH